MKKTECLPFTEELNIFDGEKKFLNQEPNETVYYINGKVIVRGDSGEYYFSEHSENDREFFMFGEQLEAEYLHPALELDDADKEIMYKLHSVNQQINPIGLYAVEIEKETVKGVGSFYAFITHPEHSENTYYKIEIPDFLKLDPENVRELLEYNEERPLDNPYCIQFDKETMIVY